MENIDKYQNKNIGIINAIKFISHLDVDDISMPDDNFKVDVTLKTGKQFFTLEFTKGSANYKEPENFTSAGSIFDAVVNCKIPKNRAEVQKMINQPGYRYILIVTDGNEVDKVFGSVKLPFRLKSTPAVLGNASDMNGYEFLFSGKSIEPAPFLNSIITP